jgi:hypothetical protein
MTSAAAATYFGSNSWLLEINGLRVLVDPWLVDALVFPPGAWLLKGELPQPWPIPEQLDLLLLTQGLADHAHPATLQQLPKTLPVVASPAAAKVVKGLGFTQVTCLSPGEQHHAGGLTIQATAGARVPMVENGYLLDWPGGSLYLEPHGVLDANLPKRKVNTVISPVIDLGLPLAGNFITGASVMPDLIERFSPEQVLASTTGGEVRFTGLISSLLNADAGESRVASDALITTPVPGKPVMLSTAQG